MEFRKNADTPNEFLNHTVIRTEGYTKDSTEILNQLKYLLINHKDFFYSKEYFEGTEIIIDTILFAPGFNKLAVLVITKNPTYRQLLPNRKHEWYYDATCYLGVRQKDSISLSRLGPNFSNSSYKQELSDDIREACFRTFVTKDTVGAHVYKYNLNDIRFWESSEWKEIENEKIKKKEFEEEKKNHPENVYEPKQ